MDASENIGSVLNESAVNKAVANIAVVGENAKILSAFDISLLLDGKKVQPNGMVKVAAYIHFYNNERIQLKTKLTPLEKRSRFVA